MDLFVWIFFYGHLLEVWNTSLFVKNPCWFGCGPQKRKDLYRENVGF